MKLILDTSGYAGFKMGNPEIVEYLTRANIIFISPIVLGELMYGLPLKPWSMALNWLPWIGILKKSAAWFTGIFRYFNALSLDFLPRNL